jgi:hypothetical protein
MTRKFCKDYSGERKEYFITGCNKCKDMYSHYSIDIEDSVWECGKGHKIVIVPFRDTE